MIETPDRRSADFPSRRLLYRPFYLLLAVTLFVAISVLIWPSRWTGALIVGLCFTYAIGVASSLRRIDVLTASIAANKEKLETRQQLLHRLSAAIETSERQKEELIGTVSREVRSAVNALIGFATQALDHPDQPPKESLLGIQRNSRRLLATMHELTDPIHMRASCEPGAYWISPWRVVEDVVTRINEHAAAHRCVVTAYPTGHIPRRLQIDPIGLRRALYTALQHGVTSSQTGRVVLQVRLKGNNLEFVVGEQDQPRVALDISHQTLRSLRPGEEILRGGEEATTASGVLTKFNGRFYLPKDGVLPVCVELELASSDRQDLVEAGELLTSDFVGEAPMQMLTGHVLLTEDTEDQRAILAYYLRSFGVTVDWAVNGQAALDSYVPDRYAVILMDMQMPVRDGYLTARELRERGCELPIIAMSADAMPDVRNRCLEAGCTEYLPKPIERLELYHSLARYLPTAPTSTRTNDHDTAGSTMNQLPLTNEVFDSAADREYFHNLLGEYLRQLPQSVSAIGEAIRSHNYSRGETLAHKLKGSAGMYGMPEISELAGLLESAMAEDRESELIVELLQMLEAATSQILADGGKAHRESWDWTKL